MSGDSLAPHGASRAQQAAKLVLAVVLAGLGLWTLHRYLPALIWAAILAIAVWPLYQRTLRRWPPDGNKIGNRIGNTSGNTIGSNIQHNVMLPAAFTAVIALVFILPFGMVAYQAGKEVRGVYETIDKARTEGIPPPEWLGHLPVGGSQATQWWQANLSNPDQAEDLLKRARESRLMANGRELGGEAVHRLVLFGFTLLTLFFLFKEGERLNDQLRRASARAFGPAGERIGRQMIASVHGTVDGLVLVGLGEGFLMGIVYLFTGVPHPTLFGLFTAIAAMVPFGAPAVFGIAALIVLTQGSVFAAILIAVFGFIVTFVADHFIRPSLIGKTTRLPFLWVLLGILGGVETWGLLGLFLGPAIMAALMLLWREWSEGRDAG